MGPELQFEALLTNGGCCLWEVVLSGTIESSRSPVNGKWIYAASERTYRRMANMSDVVCNWPISRLWSCDDLTETCLTLSRLTRLKGTQT
jgi:hypothetical protein